MSDKINKTTDEIMAIIEAECQQAINKSKDAVRREEKKKFWQFLCDLRFYPDQETRQFEIQTMINTLEVDIKCLNLKLK